MSKRYSKAGRRLRKINMQYQLQHQQWASALNSVLYDVDQDLYELWCSQTFYHRAMEALIYREEEVHEHKELMYGAFAVSNILLDRYGTIRKQLDNTKTWVQNQMG